MEDQETKPYPEDSEVAIELRIKEAMFIQMVDSFHNSGVAYGVMMEFISAIWHNQDKEGAYSIGDEFDLLPGCETTEDLHRHARAVYANVKDLRKLVKGKPSYE